MEKHNPSTAKNSGFTHSNRSYTNSNLSTANFRNNKNEVVSDTGNQREIQMQEPNLRNKTEKILNIADKDRNNYNVEKDRDRDRDFLINIERERERERYFLIIQDREKEREREQEKINIYIKDKEIEREKESLLNFNFNLKRRDSPSHSQQSSSSNLHKALIKQTPYENRDIENNLRPKKNIPINKTPDRKSRDDKSINSKSTKTRSTSVDKFKRNKVEAGASNINQSSSSSVSRINKFNSKNSKPSTPSTPNAKKSSVSSITGNRSTKQQTALMNNLQKENEELKQKVNNLEKSLKSVNYQISLDTLEKKGRDHLRVELEIWKNRSETIANSYLETMSNMKKQLLQDKANFLEQIKMMQSTYTGEIHGLKAKYQTTLDRYETTLKRLRKDNEELKNKVSKVKEILTPNNK